MAGKFLQEEKKLWKKGYRFIAGLDEAGRGPLAGPVVAAAVSLSPKFKIKDLMLFNGIKDSKKLSFKRREWFYKIITEAPFIEWGIGIVSAKIIDKINIKNAAELAMEKAVKKLSDKPDFLIIDGNRLNNPSLKSRKFELIVKADEKVFSCLLAGIIAKVNRDKIMEKLGEKYSKYGFKKNKGYPTKFHQKMIQKYGPCPAHRKTFQPVFEALKSIKNKKNQQG